MGSDTANKNCMAVVGSLTQAMRAQNALTAAAIFSRVEKAESSSTRHGCAYGVSYACAQEANVREVLRNAGIRIRGGTGGH